MYLQFVGRGRKHDFYLKKQPHDLNTKKWVLDILHGPKLAEKSKLTGQEYCENIYKKIK